MHIYKTKDQVVDELRSENRRLKNRISSMIIKIEALEKRLGTAMHLPIATLDDGRGPVRILRHSGDLLIPANDIIPRLDGVGKLIGENDCLVLERAGIDRDLLIHIPTADLAKEFHLRPHTVCTSLGRKRIAHVLTFLPKENANAIDEVCPQFARWLAEKGFPEATLALAEGVK